MRTKLILAFAIGVFLLSAAEQSRASILVFTSRAAWEAAVSSFSVEDFNSETLGGFTSRDFGDFVASRTGTNIIMSVASGGSNDINGTKYLLLQSGNHTQSMVWTFHSPISALGFDWKNTDPTNDQIEMEIALDGFQNTFGSAGGSGFFGVIKTDGTFSQVDISDTPGNGGVLSYGSFDNVSYSHQPIPEPASLAIWGGLGLGAMVLGWRRRQRTAVA